MERKWKRKSRKLAREMFWEKHDREAYECPDCGRKEEELLNTFEVHHKDGQPMDNRPENHVALCRPCHNLREAKKPSYEETKNIRDHLNRLLTDASAVETPSDSVPTDPIMTPREYTGNYGALVCPGCAEKLGSVHGSSTISIDSRPCCDLTVVMPEVPSLVVIDDEAAADTETSPKRIKEWLVSRWCEYLKHESTIQATEDEIVGFGEDGQPIVSQREKDINHVSVYLADIERLCEEWGWDHVRYAAEKSLETEKPAQVFEHDLDVNFFEGREYSRVSGFSHLDAAKESVQSKQAAESYDDVDLQAHIDSEIDPYTDAEAMLAACVRAREAGAVSPKATPPTEVLTVIYQKCGGNSSHEDIPNSVLEMCFEAFQECRLEDIQESDRVNVSSDDKPTEVEMREFFEEVDRQNCEHKRIGWEVRDGEQIKKCRSCGEELPREYIL